MSDIDISEEQEELAGYTERYGDLNPKAIKYLRENYDTYKAKQALELMGSAAGESQVLRNLIEQVYSAARDIIDDDNWGWQSYDLEEHGDLGWQVEHLRDRLSELEDKCQAARILLAPLERLIPIDDDMDTDEDMLVPWDEDSEPRLNREAGFD